MSSVIDNYTSGNSKNELEKQIRKCRTRTG